MKRTIVISLVGVVMAVQLLFLYTRHVLEHESRDYPRMSLPVAKNSRSYCRGGDYENISWTQKNGWVVTGQGKVRDEDLDDFLRSEVERHREKGNQPGLRVRIPANAPAGIFVNLTKRMEKAGVVQVRVAVFKRRFTWL